MAVAPFTRIVVDKKEEARFRRRALRRYPYEYIEALWGQVRGDTMYICAFVKMLHTSSDRAIFLADNEMDDHVEDAEEHGMHFLGTIHTHPDCEDTRFGDTDLETSQESQEAVMGICAIQTKAKRLPLDRKVVRIAYWPTVRPLITVRKDTPPPTARRLAAAGKSRRRKR